MIASVTDSCAGRLLVASPALEDPNFVRTVVLICAHSDEGAFGLVINRELEDVRVGDVLPALTGSQTFLTEVHKLVNVVSTFFGAADAGE